MMIADPPLRSGVAAHKSVTVVMQVVRKEALCELTYEQRWFGQASYVP